MSIRRVEDVWGTAVGVHVEDDVESAAIDAVYRWFQRVDDLFSTWREDSEINRIGRGELTVAAASPEVGTVLALCEDVARVSRGAFDIAFAAAAAPDPSRGVAPLDPSALVKGWAVEAAASLLLDAGCRRFCINAGGDVLVRGGSSPGQPWRVGIRHPWDRDALAAVVSLADGAVATSGNYERGDHVVDARTGRPADALVSVTVVGSDLAMADAYATAAMALGPDGISWLSCRYGIEAMVITDDRQVVSTPGFERYTSLNVGPSQRGDDRAFQT